MNMHSQQPTIAELTARMLAQTANAETLESAFDALGDVEPHEVTVGFRAEPRLAWQESLAVLATFGLTVEAIPAPGEWGRLVVRQEALAAMPFALGNYPQRVRDLGTLMTTNDLQTLLPGDIEQIEASSGLTKWGTPHVERGTLPQALIAAANYRAANDFCKAEATLNGIRDRLPAEWRAVLANEEAALSWHRGDYQGAYAAWQALPDSPAICFNRGLAALFLGDLANAQTNLTKAIAALPDQDAWHHLASLYLALADMKAAN